MLIFPYIFSPSPFDRYMTPKQIFLEDLNKNIIEHFLLVTQKNVGKRYNTKNTPLKI